MNIMGWLQGFLTVSCWVVQCMIIRVVIFLVVCSNYKSVTLQCLFKISRIHEEFNLFSNDPHQKYVRIWINEVRISEGLLYSNFLSTIIV